MVGWFISLSRHVVHQLIMGNVLEKPQDGRSEIQIITFGLLLLGYSCGILELGLLFRVWCGGLLGEGRGG